MLALLVLAVAKPPIWHWPLNVAVGSICNLTAERFPVTLHSPRNCKNSFTTILPFTLPVISALAPSIWPSTKPVEPIIIFEEHLILPLTVPSIRRSVSLIISPFKMVPALISVALLPENCLSVEEVFSLLNIFWILKVYTTNRLCIRLSVPVIVLYPVSLAHPRLTLFLPG